MSEREELKPCPSCASPRLLRMTHHNDPCSAIICTDCGFGAATEDEWNNADTPLMQALAVAKDRRASPMRNCKCCHRETRATQVSCTWCGVWDQEAAAAAEEAEA